MSATKTMDWDAVIADPRFQALHRKKSAFLWGLICGLLGKPMDPRRWRDPD